MSQAFAVVYDKQGNFLLCTKTLKSYFFHTKGDDGVIVPKGEDLDRAGNYAFPGGKWDGGKVEEWVATDFFAETGIPIVHYQLTPPAYKKDPAYIGVYYLVEPGHLLYLQQESTVRLVEGRNAAQGVCRGQFGPGDYKKMRAFWNPTPGDNTQASIDIWNLHSNWDEIQQFKDIKDLSWFYYILENLHQVLASTPVVQIAD